MVAPGAANDDPPPAAAGAAAGFPTSAPAPAEVASAAAAAPNDSWLVVPPVPPEPPRRRFRRCRLATRRLRHHQLPACRPSAAAAAGNADTSALRGTTAGAAVPAVGFKRPPDSDPPPPPPPAITSGVAPWNTRGATATAADACASAASVEAADEILRSHWPAADAHGQRCARRNGHGRRRPTAQAPRTARPIENPTLRPGRLWPQSDADDAGRHGKGLRTARKARTSANPVAGRVIVKVCPPLVPPAVVTVTVRAPPREATSSTKLAVRDVLLPTTTLLTVTSATGDRHRRGADDEVGARQRDRHRRATNPLSWRDRSSALAPAADMMVKVYPPARARRPS